MGLESLLNYVIGSKSTPGSSPGIPVKVSIDPELRSTILKSVSILSIGIALGVGAGIVISNSNKPKRK